MVILYRKSYDNSMHIKCTAINKEKADSVHGECCRPNYYALASEETEGRLLRLSGMDFRYSVSPRWAMPTPAI